jgi:hypothetical protein
LFSGHSECESIELEGGEVQQLIAPAYKQSLELIAAVDDWVWISERRRDEKHNAND